jgi:lysozyme family protein
MNFDEAIPFVLKQEGGFQKDPKDPGNWTGGKVGRGELKGTKYGISAASFPLTDIEGLSEGEAKEIYRTAYWQEIRGDDLPDPYGFLLLDAAVNQGVPRAVKTLQKSLGVTVDGVVGKETIGALKSLSSGFAGRYLTDRVFSYINTENFDIYGRTWVRRVIDLARAI